ncbi:MAG TPA: sulfite exporter TauE/SafE family protein [Methylophaga sp.]|nr:sulfite exporter TauE/SafE family protein [Methylophaga sp.]
MEWLSFAVAGIFAGLIAGLLGLGGGLILVPVLVLLFSWQGMATENIMHLAIGTSMMTICVTALASLTAHHRHQNIDWTVVKKLIGGLVAGGFLGAGIASQLSGEVLQRIFAVFVLLMAIRVWIKLPHSGYPNLLKPAAATGFGSITGVVSAFVGIGGGTLVVPYLLLAGLTIKQAIGSAAACGLPIALSAVAGFIVWAPDNNADWQTGYIVWPAFFAIASTSSICAPLGVKLARRLPDKFLRQLFSIALLAVAFYFFSQ